MGFTWMKQSYIQYSFLQLKFNYKRQYMRTQPQKQKFVIAIRIRPYLQQDTKLYKPIEIQPILQVNNDTTLTIQRKNSEEKIFRFNHIFLEETQQEIYDRSRHLVQSVFDGHNATFLAYGQTGTGKTHTIFGSKGSQANSNSKGYFHRSVYHIFSNIKQRMHSRQFAVRVSFVEFYLDNIYDLIQNNGAKLQIKETADDGIHIRDAAEVPVKSAQELFACVKSAILNRKTQQTSINKRSSRSHAIIQIQILQRWNEGGETKYLKGMLKIVDLAGSERVSKTESFGPRLQQAKRINKQITTLGKCINMLAQNQKQLLNNKSNVTPKFNFSKMYIPFRDSKITRYLTDTLEGRSKIMLCVCVSQYFVHLEQTFSSLMFATQASTLKIQSKRNEVYSMNRSAEKTPKKYSETPNKLKAQNRPLSKQSDIYKQKKDDGAVMRILQQIQQIEDYLQGKPFNPVKQSKGQLQKNLISYQKIFTIMRRKMEKQHSRKTSSINYS